MRHLLIATAGLILSTGSAFAGTPDTAPAVKDILAGTPNSQGLFVETGDGAARHVASGLICPPTIGKVNIWHIDAFVADGSDVGCDYGRNGPDKQWTAKLTIFAVRAGPGETVDTAFARYRAEVKATYPGAITKGSAIKFGDGTPPQGLEDIRSEEYDNRIQGKRYTDDLVVALRGNWVIEVRLTTATDVSSSAEAALAIGDLALPTLAMLQATSTITDHP